MDDVQTGELLLISATTSENGNAKISVDVNQTE